MLNQGMFISSEASRGSKLFRINKKMHYIIVISFLDIDFNLLIIKNSFFY